MVFGGRWIREWSTVSFGIPAGKTTRVNSPFSAADGAIIPSNPAAQARSAIAWQMTYSSPTRSSERIELPPRPSARHVSSRVMSKT